MSRRIIIGVAFIVLSLAVVFFITYQNQSVFTGSSVKNSDRYNLEFSKMNGEDSTVINLREGDMLSVNFDVSKGRVDISIGIEGENPIYKGDDINNGNFTVEIEQSGEYQISVNAKHAAGLIDIMLKEAETEIGE